MYALCSPLWLTQIHYTINEQRADSDYVMSDLPLEYVTLCDNVRTIYKYSRS